MEAADGLRVTGSGDVSAAARALIKAPDGKNSVRRFQVLASIRQPLPFVSAQ